MTVMPVPRAPRGKPCFSELKHKLAECTAELRRMKLEGQEYTAAGRLEQCTGWSASGVASWVYGFRATGKCWSQWKLDSQSTQVSKLASACGECTSPSLVVILYAILYGISTVSPQLCHLWC